MKILYLRFKYADVLDWIAIAIVGMLCAFAPRQALATTTYVSQSGGTFSGGSACNGQTAISIGTFNSGTEAAGNTYYFCGTITSSFGINGSGTSGNVITFKWDTGARISVPHGQITWLGSSSYLLFDGGVACGPGTNCDTVEAANMTGYATGQTGIIEATANGSALANKDSQTQAFYACSGCSNIEIRNLIIRNLYQHTSASDTTGSIDTGTFAFQCAEGSAGCGAGTISIHDSSLHDIGDAVSIQRMGSTTAKIYNNDFYRDNWDVENSGDGARTVYIYGNHWHDATNWDTSSDAFHHNGLHNFMNTSSDSQGFYLYNNQVDGDWGPCCATSNFLFTEVAYPANFYIFNNVVIQSCNNNTEPAVFNGASGTGPSLYNNTFLGCATTGGNVETWQLQSTGNNVANNVNQGYGQYVVTISGSFSATLMNYNVYGALGSSGNSNFQCGATGTNSFSTWRSICSVDANSQQVANVNVSATTGVPNSGSPVLSAGTNLTSLCSGALTALCSDFSGTARPTTGAWDAGAYQRTTSAAPLPPTNLVATIVN